jgi:uncharacterized protein YjbI with pentapeptide repeats
VEWCWEWVAFFLSNWAFVEVVEYAGTLSLLLGVFLYFHDAGNRLKQRHYEAWQVINTAQGKGGSGGRIEALQELNHDGVALVGVDVSGAFLQGVQLHEARLLRANFSAADVRNGNFDDANLQDADLHSANFRNSSFRSASLSGAQLNDADLNGADLGDADLSGANLDNADLRSVSFKGVDWIKIGSINAANILGVRDASHGFIEWAMKHGAAQVNTPGDSPQPTDMKH